MTTIKESETSPRGTSYELSSSQNDEKQKRLEEIRAQISAIKQQLQGDNSIGEIKRVDDQREGIDRKPFNSYHQEDSPVNQGEDKPQIPNPKKNKNREKETLEMVHKFKKRLKAATRDKKTTSNHQSNKEASTQEKFEDARQELPGDPDMIDNEFADLDKVDGDEWLRHKFDAEDDPETRLAKDANTKDDDWYTVDDPRHKYHNNTRNRYESSDDSDRYSSSRHYNHHHHKESRHSKSREYYSKSSGSSSNRTPRGSRTRDITDDTYRDDERSRTSRHHDKEYESSSRHEESSRSAESRKHQSRR